MADEAGGASKSAAKSAKTDAELQAAREASIFASSAQKAIEVELERPF